MLISRFSFFSAAAVIGGGLLLADVSAACGSMANLCTLNARQSAKPPYLVRISGQGARAALPRSTDFLNQTWHLNPDVSFLSIQTVKKNAVLENHRFTNMTGKVKPDGTATVKIDLASIATGVDIRDVRMRYLLFETFKFPIAQISARLRPGNMRQLQTRKRLIAPLSFRLDMHGKSKTFNTTVIVSRTYDNAVSVATTKPIIVKAADFRMSQGMTKLAAAVGGIAITPAAFVSFNLLFEGERFNPNVQTVVASAKRRAVTSQSATIDVAGCQSRFAVISNTRAIYFKTASAKLTGKSAPLLDAVVATLKRCPDLIVEAGGHTDNVGPARYNLSLSRNRANAVVAYLTDNGIPRAQLRAAGYGDTKPVVPNTTRANKARNRRIEFRIVGAKN